MELRHPTEQESATIDVLVQAVVDEIYGGLWSSPPVPIDLTDWSSAWVGIIDNTVAGVALTSGGSIDDLWIAARARGKGLGLTLLRRCESEIRDRDIRRANLRVVSSNLNAIAFYTAHGWIAEREYPHETLPVAMTAMWKDL